MTRSWTSVLMAIVIGLAIARYGRAQITDFTYQGRLTESSLPANGQYDFKFKIYNALGHYYKALDHIDWVAYYKNHGYQINGGCGNGGGCCPRINYAPVFVSPTMQWAVPNTCLSGPPAGPGGGCCGPYGFGH